MFYTITIAGVERDLKLFPVSDEVSIAAFIMLGDVEITTAASEALLERVPEFDVILTAEAKGITLAHEMTRLAGKNDYIVARKGKKVYMENSISSKTQSITTKGIQELFLGQDEADKLRGKRVLIVDDVVSTGGSLLSIEAIANACEANIVGKAFVLAEGDAAKRDDIIFLEPLPLFNAQGEPLR